MQRVSGPTVAAAVAGLLVVAGAIWAQYKTVEGAGSGRRILVAYVLDSVDGERATAPIIIRDSSGGSTTSLPKDPESTAVGPAWSPDGTRLLWLELFPDETVLIHFWNRETGEDQRVQSSGFQWTRLYWSPDSQVVMGAGDPVVVWDRDGRQLFAEGPEHGLPPSASYAVSGRWSPDGRRTVFRRNDSLVVYDRKTGLSVLSPSDFGLGGTFADFTPLAWTSEGTLPLANRRTDQWTLYYLDVERRLVASTVSGAAAAAEVERFVASLDGDWTPKFKTDGFATSRGVSADGRASLLAYTGSGQDDPLLTGVVVYAGGGEIDVTLKNARPPLRQNGTYDVVLVGP